MSTTAVHRSFLAQLAGRDSMLLGGAPPVPQSDRARAHHKALTDGDAILTAIVQQLQVRLAAIDGDPTLSPLGRENARGKAAKEALDAVAVTSRSTLAIEEQGRDVQRAAEQAVTSHLTALNPLQAAAVAEVRAHIRTLDAGQRLELLDAAQRSGDLEVLAAFAVQPALLAKLDRTEIRDQTGRSARDVARQSLATALAPDDAADLEPIGECAREAYRAIELVTHAVTDATGAMPPASLVSALRASRHHAGDRFTTPETIDPTADGGEPAQ